VDGAAFVNYDDESCRAMVIVEFERKGDLNQFLRDAPMAFDGFVAAEGGERAFAIGVANGTPANAHEVSVLFARGNYGASAGPFLFHVGLAVPDDYRAEFLAWYEHEHLPMLLEARGWDGCRFVEERVENGLLFHALHQLSNRGALESDARKRSRSTPWFARLARNAWFDKGFSRMLYERTRYS
jgi:hypothetical protein